MKRGEKLSAEPTGLAALLSADAGRIITIVGSGGKTSVMWYLARAYAAEKVLVSTTTKIALPPIQQYDRHWDGRALAAQAACLGITLAAEPAETPGLTGGSGSIGQAAVPSSLAVQAKEEIGQVGKASRKCCGSGEAGGSWPLKLAALSPGVLAQAAPRYDRVFIEGDGSRQLPLKGWAAHEPVVPPFTTCTLGVLTLWPLGRPVSGEIIHRLPLFCQISGAHPGEPLTPAHVAAAITSPQGLLKGSRGRKVLLINQVEDAEALAAARTLVALLPQSFKEETALIVAGSVRQGQGQVLWESR